MDATVRELLRRKLSPQAFEYMRSFWWHSSFYLPHLAASPVVRRTPMVEGFPREHAPEPLLKVLRGINVFAPTKMCRVMTKYGSDKGQYWHNYTTVYSTLFRKLQKQPLLDLRARAGHEQP